MRNDKTILSVIVVISIIFGIYSGITAETINILLKILFGFTIFFFTTFSLSSAFMRG